MDRTEIIFFLGKGGVGKTTLSLAQSIFFSEHNKKTLLISLDPAHNVQDLIEMRFTGRKEIMENLFIEEIDIEDAIEKEVYSLKETLNSLSPFIELFNLHSSLDILEFTPGLEEDAIFEVLKKVYTFEKENFDKIIIDMPPTGLALRILVLPFLKSMWFGALRKQRKRILELREIIFKEKIEKEDDILQDIEEEEKFAKRTLELMKKQEFTKFIIVVDRSFLSIKEGERIIKAFKNMNFEPYLIVVNRFIDKKIEWFKGITHTYKYEILPEPKGINALRVLGPVL